MKKLKLQKKINYYKSNYSQGKSYCHLGININNVKLFFTHKILSLNANHKLSIPMIISTVNIPHLANPVSLEKLGTIKTAPNQPAAILIIKSANNEFQTNKSFINNYHSIFQHNL